MFFMIGCLVLCEFVLLKFICLSTQWKYRIWGVKMSDISRLHRHQIKEFRKRWGGTWFYHIIHLYILDCVRMPEITVDEKLHIISEHKIWENDNDYLLTYLLWLIIIRCSYRSLFSEASSRSKNHGRRTVGECSRVLARPWALWLQALQKKSEACGRFAVWLFLITGSYSCLVC